MTIGRHRSPFPPIRVPSRHPWATLLRLSGPIGLLLLAFQPLSAAVAAKPIAIGRIVRTNDVRFQGEVLPLLQANCLPCHNQTRAKAGLNLETPAGMLRGGDSGPALVPGKPLESLLLKTAAHQVEDLVMPPADNKANARNLTPEELGLISLWIAQGGRSEGPAVDVPAWKPIATNWLSSFAVALSQDARTVAVGRANRVFLHDVKTGRLLGTLSDPNLGETSQRDVVGALAFSPDDSLIAAAGFREVRLWKREPVSVIPEWSGVTETNWVSAAFSPDHARLASANSAGRVEVREVTGGKILAAWTLAPGTGTTAVPLAWSADGHWLAAPSGTGAVQVFSPDTRAAGAPQPVDGPVAALAWFDSGRRLAVAVAGTNAIRLFRRPADGSLVLERDGELRGTNRAVTALVAGNGGGPSIVAAGSDGIVRRWGSVTNAAPQEVQAGGAVLRLGGAGAGPGVVATLAGGGAVSVSFAGTPTVSVRMAVDSRPAVALTNAGFELALSRVELARAGTLISEAEAARKSGDEALGKAREKREGHAKALGEQEADLAKQRAAETSSTRERDELAAELDRAVKAFQSADTAQKEARTAARTRAEQDADLRVAAALAERLRGELDRLVVTLPAGETNGAAAKVRESLSAAVTEAESRAKRSAEARAAAVAALDELDARAFAAGQRKVDLDRAQAELPPRKKQAEERLAAAQKSIGDLTNRISKSRITLDGSTQDQALAEKSVASAVQSVALAKSAEALARERIAAAEARVASAVKDSERVGAVAPSALGASPDGSGILLVAMDGTASRWDTASGVAELAADLGRTGALAVAGIGPQEFLVAFPDGVARVNTGRRWTLIRTLGGSDAADAPGPFVDRVNAVAFSPDGRLLATGGGDPSRAGELKLWSVPDGKLVRDFGALHSDCITSVAFSPRGEWLATGGADRFARITPVEGDGPRVALEGHTHHVLGVAWLADGSTLATAGAEGTVKLWNPQTGERRKNVEGFGKEVAGIRTVGLSAQFVALGANGRGRIVRSDGEKVRDLAAAPEYLQALAVTRDGNLAVGADDHGILSFWNLATGELRRDASTNGVPSGL